MVNFVIRFPKIFVLTCSDLCNQEKYWYLWFSNSNFAILSILCSVKCTVVFPPRKNIPFGMGYQELVTKNFRASFYNIWDVPWFKISQNISSHQVYPLWGKIDHATDTFLTHNLSSTFINQTKQTNRYTWNINNHNHNCNNHNLLFSREGFIRS